MKEVIQKLSDIKSDILYDLKNKVGDKHLLNQDLTSINISIGLLQNLEYTKEQEEFKVSVDWTFSDIHERYKLLKGCNDPQLSNVDLRTILKDVLSSHDKSIGINTAIIDQRITEAFKVNNSLKASHGTKRI